MAAAGQRGGGDSGGRMAAVVAAAAAFSSLVEFPRSLARRRVGGGADDDASALSAVPSLARATAAAGGGRRWLASVPEAVGGGQKCLGIVVQWRWRRGRRSCLWIVGRPSLAHGWRGWRRRGLTAGSVVVVRAMAGAMARHYRPFARSLVRRRVGGGADNSALADIRDQRRAEGEILGEDLRLDGPPMFELVGV